MTLRRSGERDPPEVRKVVERPASGPRSPAPRRCCAGRTRCRSTRWQEAGGEATISIQAVRVPDLLAIGFSRPTPAALVLLWNGLDAIVAFATRFLPIAYSGSESALRSIDVGWRTRPGRWARPPCALSGGSRSPCCAGASSHLADRLHPLARELSSAVFLFTPSTAVITNVIFDLSERETSSRCPRWVSDDGTDLRADRGGLPLVRRTVLFSGLGVGPGRPAWLDGACCR